MSQRAPAAAGNDLGSRDARFETWACVVLAVLVGWSYLWSAMQPASSWELWSREPKGYYALQTAGFRSGHLYAAVTPAPELLALRDPYDPAANTPYRVHDLSLYHGRYYLYFGVTPVLVLFWPFAAITGRYLSQPFAVGMFCSGAVWVGMGLLLAVRRRHFPAAPFVVLLLGWICLAWATPLCLLLEGPQVYQVPISCAALLQMLMLSAVYRALHSRVRSLAWLSLAGLLLGLSIGARPDHVAGFLVLVVAVLHVVRAARCSSPMKAAGFAKALAFAFLPPAACGLVLLCYNRARFGSFAEFGMHFQLAAERVTALRAISIHNLVPHAGIYLFKAGHWDWYFPFFSAATGQPYGLLRYAPWAWLAVFTLRRKGPSEPGEAKGLAAFACALAAAFAANLAMLACFYGTTYRYSGDFVNAGLLLAGVGALALGQKARVAGNCRIVGPALVGAAAVSLFFAAAVFVGGLPGEDRVHWLARAANAPLYAWQKGHGAEFGGLRLELAAAARSDGLAEPVIETGREADRTDLLKILCRDGKRAALIFSHAGSDEIRSREFDIPADRKILLEARFGSLLPPFNHPVYDGLSKPAFDVLRRNLRLTVNGVDVLRAPVDCYEASPAHTVIGRLAFFDGSMAQVLSGGIISVARLPLGTPPRDLPVPERPTPIKLSLYLPTAHSGADPILLTGKGKKSDLLYCIYDGANHISFALDHFGSGGPRSKPRPYDPLAIHTLVIWMGSMADSANSADRLTPSDRLILALDGDTVFNIHQAFFDGASVPALVGSNKAGSSEAGREFTGEMLGAQRLASDALAATAGDGGYGSVEMTVDFPTGVPGTQEPLAVSGVAGAGDFVYVRYVDSSHVSFGFDHWGIGGLMGRPVQLDYGATHRLTISFPSLYPETPGGRAPNLVRVLLDGQEVLAGNSRCYPATGAEITVGSNLIGGSTCGRSFTGNMLRVTRIAGLPE